MEGMPLERKIWGNWVHGEQIHLLGCLLNRLGHDATLLSLSLDIPVSRIFECGKQMLSVLLNWHWCFRSASEPSSADFSAEDRGILELSGRLILDIVTPALLFTLFHYLKK